MEKGYHRDRPGLLGGYSQEKLGGGLNPIQVNQSLYYVNDEDLLLQELDAVYIDILFLFRKEAVLYIPM